MRAAILRVVIAWAVFAQGMRLAFAVLRSAAKVGARTLFSGPPPELVAAARRASRAEEKRERRRARNRARPRSRVP